MHDNIVSVIRALGIDSNNDYPTGSQTIAGQPDRIFGVPVYVNNDMQSSVATGTKTIIAADFSKYVVRNVGGVQFLRLNERFMNEFDSFSLTRELMVLY